MSILATAIRIASSAFEHTYDKGGQPYILHCLHVMNAVSNLGHKAMIAAVLHDLLEDTDWNERLLIHEGFDFDDIELVKMLTKQDTETYETYIRRVAINPITRRIKMADLSHNSNIHRMKGLRDKDFERLKKYFESYSYLKTYDNQHQLKNSI